MLKELLLGYKTPGEHIENNGIIYDILPLPEMNISIITGFNENVAERLASASLFFGYRSVGDYLLAAMFVLRILRRIQSPHHRLQDAIENRDYLRALSADCLLSQWQKCRCWGTGAGRRQTVVGCHQIVLFRWHESKRAFLEAIDATDYKKRLEDMGDWLRPSILCCINYRSILNPPATSSKPANCCVK